VLWFDAYAGGTIFRHGAPAVRQTIVGPNIRNVPTDKAAVDDVLTNVQPKILGYLDRQITGNFWSGTPDAGRHRDRLELHCLSVSGL
jgi:glutathione S-transferase